MSVKLARSRTDGGRIMRRDCLMFYKENLREREAMACDNFNAEARIFMPIRGALVLRDDLVIRAQTVSFITYKSR